TLSVMIQMSVLRIFRGPIRLLRHQTTEEFRPFLVTPLHHHFQALNWGPWQILGLYGFTGVLIAALGILAFPAAYGATPAGWFWVLGLVLQAVFLLMAAVQKAVQANYFLGLEAVDGASERVLTLYKGLPVTIFGCPRYAVEYYTDITETMVNANAAEGVLWRSLSEIEAHVTLGKIYYANRRYDGAVEEWERVPQRNLLNRESLAVQLGEMYLKGNEYLKAIKLLEQLPAGRLARNPGLPVEIQHAKVQIGNMAGKLYHHVMGHVGELEQAVREGRAPARDEVERLLRELDTAMQYTQQLRELLDYERFKAERLGELDAAAGPDLYRRMDTILAVRRDELLEALRWVQTLAEPGKQPARTPTLELAELLRLTPAELSLAMEAQGPLVVVEFTRLTKPSRNTLYRIQIAPHAPLPERLIAKCYEEQQVTFFSACYRRERGVLQILHEAGAPVPRPLGGYLGSHQAVLFLEDLGAQDLAGLLAALPAGDRAGRLALVRGGVQMLTTLYTHVLPVLPRLEREVRKIVKEVLTPDYFLNAITIALNRILALRHAQLTPAQLGRLELALRPVVGAVLEAPKTFIHFECTPGNIQLGDGRVTAVDFEQATLGPAAFDLAALLYSPEADLSEADVEGLRALYHDQLPGEGPPLLTVTPEALDAAAILKMVFYAGSAANFYRKFEDRARVDAMEWYLRTAESLLARRDDAGELRELLGACWPWEMRGAPL
ncbi:MAG TPA: phosphotransferase, partial [Armatimonadota bacterium]|nr:phosphotransferase [Armatimonadota bacterium]